MQILRCNTAMLAGMLLSLVFGAPNTCSGQEPGQPPAAKSEKQDSYFYYGPNGLAQYWNDKKNPNGPAERLGRDTWIHWTWGNQKFLRKVSVLAGHLPVPISIDFFRALDSRNRSSRFRDLGLINEPNCGRKNKADANEPDYDEDILKKYGLYIDKWSGDPYGYYPGDKKYLEEYGSTYPEDSKRTIDLRHYGRPTGIVGLRLFPNPLFKGEAEKKWKVPEYFKNPGLMEPPFLVGFSCGFCHVAFNPSNPPKDPSNPRWENLAANLGNQYFREGEIFLARGRIIFGDQNPDPHAPNDPYKTRGLLENDFLFQYAATQQPGTSETSRISYDFINNPNTINPIMDFKLRVPLAKATTSFKGRTIDPGKYHTLNILKDGSDSVGLRWALMRVPINIFCEGDYWLERLFNPLTGRRQRPFHIAEVLNGLSSDDKKEVVSELGPIFDDVSPLHQAELRMRLKSPWSSGEEFGEDWQETWRRTPSLEKYLLSYGPSHLEQVKETSNPEDAAEAKKQSPNQTQIDAGKAVFLKTCAGCHSSTLTPDLTGDKLEAARKAFPKDDYLADDQRKADKGDYIITGNQRYAVKDLGVNLARSLGTNAIEDDIWAEFSSKEYKALPPLGRIRLEVPVFPMQAPLPDSAKAPLLVEFEPPAGGRGYYRTPSLIGMWATAPYLHNNSVGDFWVIKDGKSTRFPNDGRRIGERGPDGTWMNYPIDVSVHGRLEMFKDGVDKLLNPAKRHWWVKRTSSPCTLIPNLEETVPLFLRRVTRDIVRQELVAWLKSRGLGNLEQPALEITNKVFQRVGPRVSGDVQAFLRFGWTAVHFELRKQADRLLDLSFESIQEELRAKLPVSISTAQLKSQIREALLAKLDRLDRDLRQVAILTIPAGTPVNLYANLSANAVIHAALAHLTHRDDPRGLAKALLELSDCPDLVEDRGHTYGQDLSDTDKAALIEFLKTL